MRGHAVEARLYAEDPAKGFLPSTGPLTHFRLPHSLRVDSGVEAGGEVSPWYDPMIAKLISHAPTRQAAIGQLAGACAEVEVWPVKTNAGFLARLAGADAFAEARIDTSFIDEHLDEFATPPPPSPRALASAARALAPGGEGSPWTGPAIAGFRLNAALAPAWLQWGETALAAPLDLAADLPVLRAGDQAVVFERGEAIAVSRPRPRDALAEAAGDGQILAPMPGKIASVAVRVGDRLARGATVLTLEAMKMEHALTAPFDAVVSELKAVVGEQVTEGALLARLEPAA
jgi:acetyl/propionyl-CoA carboxylase alpha subunit